MRNRDPLEEWLVLREYAQDRVGETELDAWAKTQFQQSLDKLAAILDNPGPKKPDYHNTGLGPWGIAGLVRLSPQELATAQQLYRRVVETGGSGSTYAQEGLLNAIATTTDPATIPFWQELLDLTRPRDPFKKERRTLALAALAFMAIMRNEAAAYAALHTATRHADPTVRALAVRYLGYAYFETEQPLPPEFQADLTAIATDDKAFLPRFNARMVLFDAELPVPMDNPEGVYALKVTFMGNKHIYRTLEVRADQTLADFQIAIQRAIDWDNDHLYSFYMNGERYGHDYEFVSPWNDEGPRLANEALIGALGLTLKHKFLYLFDYGDNHEFEVEVVGIRPQADPGAYPRVIDSQGDAPEQYPGWEVYDEIEDFEGEE